MQQIIFSRNLLADVDALCATLAADRIFVLTDEVTNRLCLPLLSGSNALAQAQPIVIGATDTHKTLETLAQVWTALSQGKASRRSLLINLGGGMVTDLGGFAAATFKRGIEFINIPTTLLAMVDAAVGGKTGINFNGLKNEIGNFRDAHSVVIHTDFLRTLDAQNLRSGYAEMLKHSLLEDRPTWAAHVAFPIENPDWAELQELVRKSIAVKARIVKEDPQEQGIRKALNLGHTVGHAFESFLLEEKRPVLHGYAVAWGLLCELFLSAAHTGFPLREMRQTVDFIRSVYGTFPFTCNDYDRLYEFMLHDKKNFAGVINFTLLAGVGQILLNQRLTRSQVYESFDFLREG